MIVECDYQTYMYIVQKGVTLYIAFSGVCSLHTASAQRRVYQGTSERGIIAPARFNSAISRMNSQGS